MQRRQNGKKHFHYQHQDLYLLDRFFKKKTTNTKTQKKPNQQKNPNKTKTPNQNHLEILGQKEEVMVGMKLVISKNSGGSLSCDNCLVPAIAVLHINRGLLSKVEVMRVNFFVVFWTLIRGCVQENLMEGKCTHQTLESNVKILFVIFLFLLK